MGYVCEFKLNNKTIAKTKEITYNVGTILRKCTGLKWKLNTNNGLVKDIIGNIKNGYLELTRHPANYREFQPDLGTGTVEDAAKFLASIINLYNRFTNLDNVYFYVK